MPQVNGNIFDARAFEKLMLKCHFYPKGSTESLRSLSKFYDIFHRNKKNILNLPGTQKKPKCQSNPKNEQQNWRHDISLFQTIL